MWNGKPATFNFISDINDQKEVDLQLLESEEKYRLIAENSSDVIWVFNTHTRKITYISPAIKKLRGYTAEEAMKHTIKELVTNETYEEVEEQIKKQISLFNIDPINNNSFTLELLQPCKDGRVINVEASLNFSFNKFNEIEILLAESLSAASPQRLDGLVKTISGFNAEKVIKVIRFLVDSGKLKLKDDNL